MKNGNYIIVKAPEDFPGKKYRDKYCLEHHLVYWQHFGIVPAKNEIIHHKNKDRFDNRIENLELQDTRVHSKKHGLEKGRKFVCIVCPNCQKEFSLPYNQCFLQKGSKYTCCSRRCSSSFEHKRKLLSEFDPINTIKAVYTDYGAMA